MRSHVNTFRLSLMFAVALIVTSANAQAPADFMNTAIAGRADYTIGIGDVLHVSVWNQDQITRDVTVRPDGRITLPLIPEIVASGLTVAQATNSIAKELSPFVKSPRVTVSVVEVKSKVIYVTGEVLRPGGYLLTSPTSVLQLLVRAGGPTDFAKLKKAYVLRGSGQRLSVNLKNILAGKELDSNVALAAGDTVVIP